MHVTDDFLDFAPQIGQDNPHIYQSLYRNGAEPALLESGLGAVTFTQLNKYCLIIGSTTTLARYLKH